jgi:excisionase family DNA binding protein
MTMRPDPYRTDPSILTTVDVAHALQISKKAVYALIHSGELASFRRGRQYLIRKTDLQVYQAKTEKRNNADKFEVELPQSIIESFAYHLVTEIRKYYDSEEGQSVFTEWLKQQEDT